MLWTCGTATTTTLPHTIPEEGTPDVDVQTVGKCVYQIAFSAGGKSFGFPAVTKLPYVKQNFSASVFMTRVGMSDGG